MLELANPVLILAGKVGRIASRECMAYLETIHSIAFKMLWKKHGDQLAEISSKKHFAARSSVWVAIYTAYQYGGGGGGGGGMWSMESPYIT